MTKVLVLYYSSYGHIETMAKAVAMAVAEAEPGDTILLAPAAASFDQYDNFEKRGEDFIAEVAKFLG